MVDLICKVCSGELERIGNYYVCRHCRHKWMIDVANDVNAVQRAHAWEALRVGDFEKASELFEEIILKDNTNYEAYWGKALSINAIHYVEDLDGEKVPTCNNITEESFISNKDVVKAIELAPKEIKETYKIQAEKIEKIRIEWLEKASKEPPYDIFISYKDSDRENGLERTKDSVDAQEIYTSLVEIGYKVFFSRVSLRDKVSEQYEPYIYNALKTAKVMIVFGEKAKYFNATWVKNEWSRFIFRIKNGEKHKNSLVVVYKDMDVHDLPTALKSRQAMNMGDLTFLENLKRHIKHVVDDLGAISHLEKIEIKGGQIAKKSSTIQTETIKTREVGSSAKTETSISDKQKLSLAYTYINGEMWEDASKFLEDILFENPNNTQALMLTLFVKYKSKVSAQNFNFNKLFERLDEFKNYDIEKIEKVIIDSDKEFAKRILNSIYNETSSIEKYNYLKLLRKILPFNFSDRNKKIQELFKVSIEKSVYDVFNTLLSTLDSADVDAYIDYNLQFLKATENFEYKRNCIKNVLSVQEGNVEALKAKIQIDLLEKNVDDFKNSFENVLKYSTDIKKEVVWFLNEVNGLKALDKQHCSLVNQALKYYPSDITEIYSEISKVSSKERVFGHFASSEKLSAILLGCNKEDANIYWNICLCKIKAKNNDGVLKSDIRIKDIPEFTKYLTFIGEEERLTALNLAKNQEKAIQQRISQKEEKARQAEENRIKKERQAEEERKRKKAQTKEDRKSALGHGIGVLFGLCLFLIPIFLVLRSQCAFFRIGCGSGCGGCSEESGYVKMELSDDQTYYVVTDWWLDSKTEIVIPDTYKDKPVKEIAKSAFREFGKLESIVIPDSVERIGNLAFQYCYSLRTVYIGNGVVDIGEYAFGSCNTLNSITIGSGVKNIGENAFETCTSLSNVNYNGTVENWSQIEFDTIKSNPIFHSGSIRINNEALTNLTLENITEIKNYAFYNCDSIKTVIIPNSVTSMGLYVFSYCDNIESMTIPFVGATASGTENAYFGYLFGKESSYYNYNKNVPNSLKNVIINSGTTIKDHAFYNCVSIESIGLPSELTSIGKSAFYSCKALNSIALGNNVNSIGTDAFKYCTSLTKIILPISVNTVGNSAFRECKNLTICCEASSKPSGFHYNWNYDGGTVVWGYTGD